MTRAEQLAELAALGVADPSAGPEGDLVLSPQQLEQVLALSRRHRLEANALRRAITEITHDLAELTHRLRAFGPELRRMRAASAIGLGQLARALGVDTPVLSKFEIGEGQPLAPERKRPSPEEVAAMHALLHPAGACTCGAGGAGGTCEWCRMDAARGYEDPPEDDPIPTGAVRITTIPGSDELDIRGDRKLAEALGFGINEAVLPAEVTQAEVDAHVAAEVERLRQPTTGTLEIVDEDTDPCPICGSNMLEDGFCLACEDLNREEGEEL